MNTPINPHLFNVITTQANPSAKAGTGGWKCILLSSGLLALAGCSPHHPTAAPSLATAAKAQKTNATLRATASKTVRSPSPYANAAMESAADQILLMPYLDGSQSENLDLPESDLRLNGQSGMIWDRLRGGFSLSLDESQSVRRELDALSPRFIERSLAQSSEYLYLVLDEVERRGMPAEIALLPLMESGYNPAAVSPGKAAGLWQFLPQTARNFGLKLTQNYDGRHDVLASTKAALDYLEHLGDMFGGDWLLALTAYNTGEGILQRWIEQNRRLGKPTDFASLPIPPQTRRYIPRLMAMRSVIENPRRHGVELPAIPNRPVLDSVDVRGRLDLAQAADLADLSLPQLLRYNPAIQAQKNIAPPGALLLPAVHARRLRQKLEGGEALQLAQQSFETSAPDSQKNDKAQLIQEAERVLAETPMRNAPLPVQIHVVRSGDSLYTIARAHRIDTADLAKWNKLPTKATLKIGQTLVVQDPFKAPSGRAVSSASGSIIYAVQAGDSLSSIAHKFEVSVAELTRWNAIKAHQPLRTGQRLSIRKSVSERRTQS
jgi:membrane-bound lytic murein transglycosylase D